MGVEPRLEGRAALHPRTLIEALARHGVDFIVVGGLAAVAHGVQRLTRDLDLLVDPNLDNCRRLIEALVSVGAEICAPTSQARTPLDIHADPQWIVAGNRFFDTRAGGVDIWNRSDSLPSWGDAGRASVEVKAFGTTFRVLDRDSLIASKLSAGREKDLRDVAELTES